MNKVEKRRRRNRHATAHRKFERSLWRPCWFADVCSSSCRRCSVCRFKNRSCAPNDVLRGGLACALALGTPRPFWLHRASGPQRRVDQRRRASGKPGRLKAIAFDKTGTITHGQPEVTDVVQISNVKYQTPALRAGASVSTDEVLALAAAVESRSGIRWRRLSCGRRKRRGWRFRMWAMLSRSQDVAACDRERSAAVIGNLKLNGRVSCPRFGMRRAGRLRPRSHGKTTMAVALDSHIRRRAGAGRHAAARRRADDVRAQENRRARDGDADGR